MWDIMVEDVERIRKIFNVPDEIDEIVQPLIPEPIHTTPPNDDYVAPATKSMLDELFKEFRDEILNVTKVNKEADFNPTKGLEELERLLAMRPQSNFTEIQIGTFYLLEGEMQDSWKMEPRTIVDWGGPEEDSDDGDTFDMWDITVEDVERIRKIFNVPNELDEIVQPLIPEPIHTIPPNDDYVAPATKSMLDELFEEFRDEILNVTKVNEEADFNPTKGLEELERLLAMRPQSNFTEIQVHSVTINTEPFIHTQLMSSLYGVFKTSKPCKVDRDILSTGRFVVTFQDYDRLHAYDWGLQLMRPPWKMKTLRTSGE
ncbi:hypothetical protein Tco_1001969 [Tanacetum coccineum]|uniref:DUF4283 domain-containing protein n=1 Tax=Tanacetum coccineum TaxID=301880 RepID=A0ABQ5F539_9ASTR